jgi:hypothetical protein
VANTGEEWRDVADPTSVDERIFKELSEIRKEIHALRKAVQGQEEEDEIAKRLAELDIEIRLAQIEADVREEQQPKRKGLFRRKKK